MDTNWGFFSIPITECVKFATKKGLKKIVTIELIERREI